MTKQLNTTKHGIIIENVLTRKRFGFEINFNKGKTLVNSL